MFTALNLSRLGALVGTVSSALVIFTSAAAPDGKYTAGGVFAGILAVWIHEEHATERNATTAAASLQHPPAPSSPPAPPVPDLSAMMDEALGKVGLSHLVPPAPPSSSSSAA